MMFSHYQRRYQNEVAHYQEIFKDTLFQAVPPVWNAVEAHFSTQIMAATGVTGLPEYIARAARGKKRLSVLSLGSSSCGVELVHLAPLLKKNRAPSSTSRHSISTKRCSIKSRPKLRVARSISPRWYRI